MRKNAAGKKPPSRISRIFKGRASWLLAAAALTGCQTLPTLKSVETPLSIPAAIKADDPNLRARFEAVAPIQVQDTAFINSRVDMQPVLNNWAATIERHEQSLRIDSNRTAFNLWLSQFDHLRNLPLSEKALSVDGIVDDYLTFKEDKKAYNVPEYWAIPLETLAVRTGDCEDYATLKYFILRYLDVPADMMFITAIRKPDNTGHANLAIDLCTENCGQDQDMRRPLFGMLDENDGGSFVQGKYATSEIQMLMNENGMWEPYEYLKGRVIKLGENKVLPQNKARATG